ncbi:hypothetical protein PybrP1_004615 [[Pythium] brassicae (nom. inval.)]|nr:hypothetical protein PybrP1_004615 [[Pythium] brassicae (nom. inval.)]
MLSRRGIRKQSLNVSGALAAFVVALFSISSGYRFGVLLLGFYFSGSRLTKVRAAAKQKLDANYKVGGQRSARQVLAVSVVGTGIAVYYVVTFGDLDARIDFAAAPLRSFLLASYIGHYACCAADTWASELGVLSAISPRMITTFRVVPAGTNGAVSALGLVVSALGGAFVGGLYWAVSLLSGTAQVQVVLLGTTTGLLGSLLDSLLGATLQATWFDAERRMICEERHHASSAATHVSGADVLTNEQVNAISVVATTLASGLLAPYLGFA